MELDKGLLSSKPKPTLAKAAHKFFIKAAPTILSYIFQMGIEMINLLFLGHIDKYRMDGVGLGNMWANISGVGIGWGLAGALDTLCSQAAGNKDPRMVGIWIQRGLVVMTAFMVPISAAWLYTKEFLVLINVDEVIAQYSYNYLVRVLPGLWFFLAFDCIRRFLNSQGYFWPCLIVNLITTLLHLLWSWIFVVYFGWLEEGAGAATCLTYVLTFCGVLVVVWLLEIAKPSWPKIDFTDFWPQLSYYLKYGLPSALSLFIDQINYEITQYEANQLGVTEQTSHIGASNTTNFFFMITLGISITISAVVGNYVGKGDPYRAKLYAKASCVVIFCLILPIVILLMCFRSSWSKAYTYVRDSQDPEVQDMLSTLLPFSSTFVLIDCFEFILLGILKGIARQREASIAIFVSYNLCSLPFGYFLAFHCGFRIYGIWIG
jgi:MATE family multidrug resistance protein